MSPVVRRPLCKYSTPGTAKLKKSRPLPDGPLSHATAWNTTRDPTFCGASTSTTSRLTPSNSTPRVESAQAVAVALNPVIPVSGVRRVHHQRDVAPVSPIPVLVVHELAGQVGAHVEVELIPPRRWGPRVLDLAEPDDAHARATHGEPGARRVAGRHRVRLWIGADHRTVLRHARELDAMRTRHEGVEGDAPARPDWLAQRAVYRDGVTVRIERRARGAGRDHERPEDRRHDVGVGERVGGVATRGARRHGDGHHCA